MDPLNIVVICLDTFRADIVGPGHKLSHVKTPNLDQLAAESVRFTRCFGEAQATLQVRNGCFTGMRFFPSILGYYGWHEIPDEYPTVAETLVRNGYSTGLIGDTPHMFKPNMNFSRGFLTFEHIRGQTSDSWKAGSWDLVKELFKDYFGEYVPKVPQHSGSTLYSEGQVLQYLHNIRDRKDEGDWFAPRVFSSAYRWIEDNARNRPFFLWLDCFETHEIFDPPESYIRPYNSSWTGPKYQQPKHILNPSLDSDISGDSVAGLSQEFVDYYVACYMAEVTFTDKWIGMFLERLGQLGLTDSTVVIFTSDHGTELADRSGLGKRGSEPYPFNTQLNLTIRHPGPVVPRPRGGRLHAEPRHRADDPGPGRAAGRHRGDAGQQRLAAGDWRADRAARLHFGRLGAACVGAGRPVELHDRLGRGGAEPQTVRLAGRSRGTAQRPQRAAGGCRDDAAAAGDASRRAAPATAGPEPGRGRRGPGRQAFVRHLLRAAVLPGADALD